MRRALLRLVLVIGLLIGPIILSVVYVLVQIYQKEFYHYSSGSAPEREE